MFQKYPWDISFCSKNIRSISKNIHQGDIAWIFASLKDKMQYGDALNSLLSEQGLHYDIVLATDKCTKYP